MTTPRSDQYAIIVGIDHYVDLPPLRTAISRAQAVAEWLTSPESGRMAPQNLHLLLSTPGPDSAGAGPSEFQILRALRYLGGESGERIGRRLIFYFAGYSTLSETNEVALLMADGSLGATRSCISVPSYLRFFQESAPFDEVLFVLDAMRADSALAGVQVGEPLLTWATRKKSEGEVALLAIGHHPAVDEGVGEDGLLTRAVLEGLSGQATGADGRITAGSLASYAGERVAEWVAEQSIENPTRVTVQQSGDFVFGEAPVESLSGTLLVELPHWTATINVYDSMFRQISGFDPFVEFPPGSGVYRAELTLAKGIYQVEAHLAGETERQLVLVQAGKTTAIKQDSWKSLAFESTAPLTSASTLQQVQAKHAEESSRNLTWEPTREAGLESSHPATLQSQTIDSRLFLFVRTDNPKEHPSFSEGLRLLNQNGETVTDFTGDMNKGEREGWAAFNADLPSGYYILRRGRRGVRVQLQPIYLCAKWETHVFLQARHNFPSLSSMALDMSRLGSGFQADAATTAAATAVLNSLGQSAVESEIVGSERLRTLLNQKYLNPWLGILAAYAMLRASESERSESDTLLQHVLSFLNENIGDHPDVRALHLRNDEPAELPFWNPPIVRFGLERVRAHAIRHAGTIPLDCLCDVVLDNYIANTPWTAWYRLDRKPLSPSGTLATGFELRRGAAAGSQQLSPDQPITGLISPKLPVYRFAEMPATDVQGQEALVVTAKAAPVEPENEVRDSVLAQQALTLAGTTDYESLPDSVQVNLSSDADSLLRSVNPEDVSAASGVPLARAERGLTQLRHRWEKPSNLEASAATTSGRRSKDEQVVFHYAEQQQVTPSRKAAAYQSQETVEWEEGVDLPVTLPALPAEQADVPFPATGESIEEITLSLQTEADRLLLRENLTGEPDTTRALAGRLRVLTAALLERADHVILTDLRSNIIRANGAFVSLISPERDPVDEPGSAAKRRSEEADLQRLQNRRRWEDAIRDLQPSDVIMIDPLKGANGPVWEFKRTTIIDENGSEQAFLYAFRRKGVAALSREILDEVRGLMPDLTRYSAMFAYSSSGHTAPYLINLEATIASLEALVH